MTLADPESGWRAWRGLWQIGRMTSGAVEQGRIDDAGRRLRQVLLALAAWSAIAVVFAAQGWWAAQQRGSPQPWWPSLGYSVALFSIWALLTGPILGLAGRIERSGLSRWKRVGLYVAGFPLATAGHVGLFALLYWPLYNDGGKIPSPLAMAERMLVPNAHTNLVFYAGLVAIGVAGVARARKRDTEPAGPSPQRLRIRSRGLVRDLAFEEIDWIGAAGDYAEVHCGDSAWLIEESLTALAARLPTAMFARIHRRTIVRLALIREVRSQGRGDALVRLADGTELRVSRRYRAAAPALRQAIEGQRKL
jgi:two-component system LytT family response regulator